MSKCETCQQPEHDQCPLTLGSDCSCCANTIDQEWLAEENRMLKIAERIADDACQEINKQAVLLKKSGVTKPYLAQELLEEVIKILQERV